MTEYTLILNYYNKSLDLMKLHLDHCLNQSLPPKYIFGCFLGLEDEHLHLLEYFKERTKDLDNVFTIESNFNFKYIGRYQIALGAPTERIIMLDDDRFPMPDYAKAMMSVLDQGNCLVQQSGWALEFDKTQKYIFEKAGDGKYFALEGTADMTGTFYNFQKERLKEGHNLIYADYLCGGMVFNKSSLKYLFAEEIPIASGEDIAFCMRCTKNGIPVFFYAPEDSAAGDQEALCHDSGGVNFTANDLDIWKYRSLLIHKELGMPFGPVEPEDITEQYIQSKKS